MKKEKRLQMRFPSKSKIAALLSNIYFRIRYPDSVTYWERRYARNGTSGAGSYGVLADYKADILNTFVKEKGVEKVIELGCGDGNQLQQFRFPKYAGFDVSVSAIEKCRDIFKDDVSKSFFVYKPPAPAADGQVPQGDLSLSLDVIYHLLEDDIFESYMRDLFSSSKRFVIIYAWDVEVKRRQHVRHRKFTKWIAENITGWDLVTKIASGEVLGACDFFIYEKVN